MKSHCHSTYKFEETERGDVHALPGLTFSIRRYSS